MVRIAVLGLGSRGKNYGGHLSRNPNVQIVSVCDKFQNKIDKVKGKWNVPDDKCFTDDEKFFAQGKIADAMIIATQDRDHYGHAMRALDLGYDLILEKPVSPFIEQTLEIERKAREKGARVLVCHVLRYAPYYRRIKKMIDSGVLGDIVSIKHDENISYWHFAHSYVRGNWRREEETSPMLLAKCCHDMDLLYWYTGSKFAKVNSYGGLKYFTEESAPEGSAARCADCALKDTCIYEARYQYIGRPFRGKKFPWGTYAFCQSKSKADIAESLEKGEKGRLFGRCVFRCDNNVVDNQTVNIEFENGVRCVMTVTAFNEKNHRHTEIRGTKGTLIADDSHSILEFQPFDGRKRRIRVNLIPIVRGHYGGDQGLMKAATAMLENKSDPGVLYTWISDTVESHRIVAAAEKSRKEGGRLVTGEEIPDIE